MTKIRISKEFKFETSHVLKGYDGLCRNIHGHSYRLKVVLAGTPKEDAEDPKNGMVMDFGHLKKIIKENIEDVFDHSLVVNESISEEEKEAYLKITERIIFTPYQPTCENMLMDIKNRIKNLVPSHVKLAGIRLYETATSYAEWRIEDNDHEDQT
jgi:6-pyruvoyltetrahydropterin/6-carboxytetrahydropterin synthase